MKKYEGLPAEDIVKAVALVRNYLYAVDKRILNVSGALESDIIIDTGIRDKLGRRGHSFTIRKITGEWQVVKVARVVNCENDDPEEVEGLPAEDIVKAVALLRNHVYDTCQAILNIRVTGRSEIVVNTGSFWGPLSGRGDHFTIRKVTGEWQVAIIGMSIA